MSVLNHAQCLVSCRNLYVDATCCESPLYDCSKWSHEAAAELSYPKDLIEAAMAGITIGSFKISLFSYLFSLRSLMRFSARMDISCYRSSLRQAAFTALCILTRGVQVSGVSLLPHLYHHLFYHSLVLEEGCDKGLVRSSKSRSMRNRLLAALKTFQVKLTFIWSSIRSLLDLHLNPVG